MTGPYAPPPGALPPDAPATVEDVRATRRWTWVAFAWAIAASVIAVLALVKANDNSSNTSTTQTGADPTAQIQQFEKQTNDRLDAFSRRLNDAAAAADVTKLDKRLTQVEDAQSKAGSSETDQSNTIKQIQTDVADLKKRVGQLEQQQAQQGQGTTTTP